MNIQPNILSVIHKGAPCCRDWCERSNPTPKGRPFIMRLSGPIQFRWCPFLFVTLVSKFVLYGQEPDNRKFTHLGSSRPNGGGTIGHRALRDPVRARSAISTRWQYGKVTRSSVNTGWEKVCQCGRNADE